MNDESLASCPVSTSVKMRQFDEQVNVTVNMNQARTSEKHESEFLSAGLWLATLVFLSLTVTFATLSGFFSIFNIWFNPVWFIFGVFGLYVWNGIAAGFCFLTIIFWTLLYFVSISDNIGITDTLRSTAHYSSNDLVKLGFSFWILFVTIACHLMNIRIVYYRNIFLQRQPRAPAITVNKNDSTILVY